MSVLNSRTAAVALGASIIVGLGATGAMAANLITNSDIQPESITGSRIKNGSLSVQDFTPATDKVFRNTTGTTGVKVATLANTTAIANIGGPINANNTNLGTGVTLAAGKYLVTVSGDFENNTAATDDAVDTYPQLSLWLDHNNNGDFEWNAPKPEGDISPNATMPHAKGRHISVSGTTVITLDKTTKVGLIGFGYNSDGSAARGGDIDVTNATITATPLR